MDDQGRFAEKVVIITGAGSGIGQTLAINFAEQLAVVFLVGRTRDKLEDTLRKINSLGHTAHIKVCDIENRDKVIKTVDSIAKKIGRIDVLINNAGVSSVREVIELEKAEWEKTIRINLTGTFFFCQAVTKHMILQRSGKIINMASIHAFATYPLRAAYAASKGGIVTLTKSLGLELARYGINVNCIAPGQVITENVQKIIKAGKLDLKRIEERTPIGRIATPEDIVGPTFFLASDDSRFMVGQTLIIDGGYLVNAAP